MSASAIVLGELAMGLSVVLSQLASVPPPPLSHRVNAGERDLSVDAASDAEIDDFMANCQLSREVGADERRDPEAPRSRTLEPSNNNNNN